MEGWQIVVLTSMLSLISAVVVALITAVAGGKMEHDNEVKKLVYEKRTELYFEFFSFVEKVIANPELIIEGQYFSRIIAYKAKINLLASEETSKNFDKFFEYAGKKRTQILNSYNAQKAHDGSAIDPAASKAMAVGFVSEMDSAEFTDSNHKLNDEKNLEIKEFRALILPLYESMRKDLGSNL